MLESSKSDMNTFAPELSALMIILRSTGPVISARRSCRSAGAGATFQLRVVPDVSGLGEEVRYRAGVERGGPLHPLGQQLLAPGLERPVQRGHQRERVGREDLRLVGGDLRGDLDSVRESDGAHGSRDTFLDASSSRADAPSAPEGATASVVERRCRPGPSGPRRLSGRARERNLRPRRGPGPRGWRRSGRSPARAPARCWRCGAPGAASGRWAASRAPARPRSGGCRARSRRSG